MRETENKCVSFEIYNEPLLGIKEIAKLLNVHQRTLRIYDKENIFNICSLRNTFEGDFNEIIFDGNEENLINKLLEQYSRVCLVRARAS